MDVELLFVGLFVALISAVGYFLPFVIAAGRGHRNRGAIFVVNLFFGWTMIGWVGCLAWSLTHQPTMEPVK